VQITTIWHTVLLDLEFGNRSSSYLPTTRSRLQGLKQLSVEKLISLRQRLAETRSKGASAMAVNIHFQRGKYFLKSRFMHVICLDNSYIKQDIITYFQCYGIVR
jgi:hypothetical protein